MELESLTPKKITYPPSSVGAGLQAAGMYETAFESLPEIIGFRRLLHVAEGEVLTQKTKQLYNNVRKIYQYLINHDSEELFSEDNLLNAFDILIGCGLQGDSLGIWIKGIKQFMKYSEIIKPNMLIE